MAEERQRKRRKRSKTGRTVYTLVTVVVIIAAIILSITLFFRVSDVKVEGCVMCDPAAIEAVAGIEKGGNIFTINKSAISRKLFDAFPWVREINIKRDIPSTVVIKVTECRPAACANSSRGLWIMDENCKLLQTGDAQSAEGLISILGIDLLQPVAGDTAAFVENSSLKVPYLRSLLKLLKDNDMAGGVTYINMLYHTNVEFDYLGRFVVSLGGNVQLENKIIMLGEVVNNLAPNAEGTIDLSNPAEAHFIPY
ncbi:MAG: FtsQ-type POTRA domain-containing protein [Oscillospiraceae bacterium]|nr:FtsQ-type POTRA domain-containing protein [Oscillospiraceae bacterium]